MRGDIYRLRANPHAKGHEQRGHRFAVVVQSETVVMSTVVAAPTTTGSWDGLYHPEVAIDGQRSRILIEQMLAVDPEKRFGDRVGRVTPAEQEDIDRALRIVLGLY
jgi:mRNA interferase MazF